MLWHFDRAENGNVALAGELDWQAARNSSFVIAIGFGTSAAEAGHRATASLLDDFDELKARYIQGWRSFHSTLRQTGLPGESAGNLEAVSAVVLRIHEAKRFPGGVIASLSIPWGFNKGDEDLGGYHLVWPRDLVESAVGLLAIGAHADTVRVLNYLLATQEADGHWPQNMWLDGTPYWSGSQMDETAFPILLVDLALREKALKSSDVPRFWPMIRRASQYIVCNGPVTQQDRWEEDPGYSPFTLAVEIAALLAAADIADLNNEATVATYLRETADAWNSHIERWIYVSDTELAKRHSVDGYYVRIAPPETADGASPLQGFVPIKNRPVGKDLQEADQIISQDALALVRFGLRAADDPRILNTVRIIDALLKLDTPFGPAWHRYNADGYGEHEDGSPFDGTGIGRAWPLLSGERGHYELAAGKIQEALALLKAMEGFANETGLIPEQIWDADDVREKELKFGRPSGSAMPLVWAHAEYLKLRRSIADHSVFDMPPQTVQRYQVEKVESPRTIWRFNHKCRTMVRGRQLRIETLSPATVHWSVDGWRSTNDTSTRDTGLGVYIFDMATEALHSGERVDFTFYWPDVSKWEQTDFAVIIEEV